MSALVIESILASLDRVYLFLRPEEGDSAFKQGHRPKKMVSPVSSSPSPSPGEAGQGGRLSFSPQLSVGCGYVPGVGLGTTT